MIFSNLFHRKKNKESETGSFSQYDQSEYAKLETKNIVKELNLSDAAQAKKYVVDLCKQMIQASKDIEDSKSEYQLVTNYLTDIQILEDLTDAERKPILECATQVAKLEKAKNRFPENQTPADRYAVCADAGGRRESSGSDPPAESQ